MIGPVLLWVLGPGCVLLGGVCDVDVYAQVEEAEVFEVELCGDDLVSFEVGNDGDWTVWVDGTASAPEIRFYNCGTGSHRGFSEASAFGYLDAGDLIAVTLDDEDACEMATVVLQRSGGRDTGSTIEPPDPPEPTGFVGTQACDQYPPVVEFVEVTNASQAAGLQAFMLDVAVSDEDGDLAPRISLEILWDTVLDGRVVPGGPDTAGVSLGIDVDGDICAASEYAAQHAIDITEVERVTGAPFPANQVVELMVVAIDNEGITSQVLDGHLGFSRSVAVCMPQVDGSDADIPECAGVDASCVLPDFELVTTVGASLASGNTCAAGDDHPLSCAGSGASPEVAFKWVAPSDGRFQFDTNGSTYDTALTLRSPCFTDDELDCDDDGGSDTQSLLVRDVTAGEELIIAVEGYSGACGDYVLNITELAPDTGSPDTDTPSDTGGADTDTPSDSGAPDTDPPPAMDTDVADTGP